MKFRQAKKIIKRELNNQVKGRMSWYGWLWGPPRWLKATTVYIHHMKKTNLHYYESRGIIKEYRNFYEGKKTYIQNK